MKFCSDTQCELWSNNQEFAAIQQQTLIFCLFHFLKVSTLTKPLVLTCIFCGSNFIPTLLLFILHASVSNMMPLGYKSVDNIRIWGYDSSIYNFTPKYCTCPMWMRCTFVANGAADSNLYISKSEPVLKFSESNMEEDELNSMAWKRNQSIYSSGSKWVGSDFHFGDIFLVAYASIHIWDRGIGFCHTVSS